MTRELPKVLIDRLRTLDIEIELGGNVPWIYLRKVNGKSVKELYAGNHGFTAFWYPSTFNGKIKFSDRRKVFQKIREMISGEEPDYEYENQNV